MPEYCPHCGSEKAPMDEYCQRCLMRLPTPQRVEAAPAPPVQKPLPAARARDPAKIVMGVMIVVLIAALALSFTQGTNSTTEVDDLRSQLSSLTSTYNSLQGQYTNLNQAYADLNQDYTELNSNYHTLQAQYQGLQDQLEMSSDLRIGVTLATYYDYVRAHVSESAVEFEANVAAHDAGHLYWPSLEEDSDYVAKAGLNESADRTAFRIINTFLGEANITSGDSDVVKIDKILRLINSYITYGPRSDPHILFPTEILTFRSGDCTGFSVLAACLFEEVGIESAIGYFDESIYDTQGHSMVLVHLDNLGSYTHWYYSDLTGEGLSPGKWIVIEPQDDSLSAYSNNMDWVSSWSLDSASEVPYGP